MKNFLLSFFIIVSCCVYAQQDKPAKKLRVETVMATYTYKAPEDMPPVRARSIAIQRAQTQAIADVFGTVVSETNIISSKTNSGHTSKDYVSIGESDVRGEWIETIGDTTWHNKVEGNEIVYQVALKGRIREINTAAIDTNVELLFNGTDPKKNKVRNFTFFDGDAAYIYFQSPVNGYLTVFIVDDNPEQTVQRLLPYPKQTEGAYVIEANKEYILFSRDDEEEHLKPFVRRCLMRSRDDHDVNQLYVIFSPNQFAHSADLGAGENLPRQLSFDNFQKWLGKSRRRDQDMTVQKYIVEIVKN